MQLRATALLALAAAGIIGVGCVRGPARTLPDPSRATLQVWEAALHAYFGQYEATRIIAVSPVLGGLQDPPRRGDSAIRAWLVAERIPEGAYWTWVSANRHPTQLTRPPKVEGFALQLAEPDIAPTPQRPILDLTLPGLSSRGDTAYVVIGQTCGPLCGSALRLILVHDSLTPWTVVRRWDIQH